MTFNSSTDLSIDEDGFPFHLESKQQELESRVDFVHDFVR